MDNVTHSLAGLLVAEGALRLRTRLTKAEPSPRFRTVAAISSVIAANLPDADLVYSGLGGSHLRYMLQHRGYTHTVLFAIVGAVAAYGVSTLVWRSRDREAPTQEDAHWLLGLLLVSTLSHLVLDWTNSYGVHPFWPVDNRWYYGDAVFIIEPWLWVVSVPILVRATGNGVARVVLSLVMLAGLALAWRMDFVSRGAAAALTLAAVLFVVLALVLRAGPRVVTARCTRSKSGSGDARHRRVAIAGKPCLCVGDLSGTVRRFISRCDGAGERCADARHCVELRREAGSECDVDAARPAIDDGGTLGR
jgi:inner membrane protein